MDLIQRNLYATANPGYSFLGWTSNQTLTFSPSWMSSDVVVSPQSDSILTSHFAPITHKVQISYDSSKGVVTGGGSEIATNTSRSIIAQPSENQIFHSWEINKTIVYQVTRENSGVDISSTRLFIDGTESPALSLIRGFTYRFVNELSNGEKIFLSTNKDSLSSSAFLSGIIDSQDADGMLTFSVPEDAPDQLYYCSSQETYSGNVIRIISKSDEEILPFPTEAEIEPFLEYDLALHATFIGREISTTIIETEGGSIQGAENGQVFSYNDSVEVIAVPDEHYEFVRWELSESVSSSIEDPNLQFNILDSLSLRAVFQPKSYTLTLVSFPTDAGNAFTTTNIYTYTHNSVVPIQVIPLPGNRFENWIGNVSDPYSLSTNVTINGDTTVTAQFSETLIEISKQTLALDPDGNIITDNPGVITGGDSFALGAIARFTAYPNEGFEFKRWEDEDGNVISSSSSSNIQITGFDTLIAVFEKLLHEVQVIANPSGKGEVQWTGRGTGEMLTGRVLHGETISLHASPIPGYLFEKWTSSSGDLFVLGQESLELPVSKPMIVNARFVPINPVELTITVYPENSGWTFGQGIVNQNAKYPILAKPNPGYIFDRWEGLDVLDPNSANTSLDLNQDKQLIAYFKTDPTYNPDDFPLIDQLGIFNLRVTTADILKGSVSGSGVFGTGWAEIKAFPQKGYDFVKWEGSGIEDEYALNTYVFLSQDTVVEALFEPVPAVTGSEKLASSWWQSDWFGTYWNFDGNWIYQTKLGWLHIPEQTEFDSMWVWFDKIGAWVWTGKNVFPYFYHHQLNCWIWIDTNQTTPSEVILFKFDDDLASGNWLRL